MTLTLLLDLDDTLLKNEINAFMKEYLRLLSAHLAPYVDAERLSKCLWAGTAVMAENSRPDLTLEDAFDRVFYPGIGVEKQEIFAELTRFYREIFPQLQEYTTALPATADLIKIAFERGWRIGIATDPLFPLAAAEHRLAWAGIPVETHAFALVPSLETFHFSKLNPAFYAEFLGRLGWLDGGVVMVGDSAEKDIRNASMMGIATYWIEQDGPEPEIVNDVPNGRGDLAGLLPWIDSQPEEALIPRLDSASALKAILRATPAIFDHLARTLPEGIWRQRPSSEEWCLAEICCHLRDVEAEVNLPRLRKMAEEINPFLPGSNTDPWVDERQYIKQDYLLALKDFTRTRMEVLSLLEGLDKEDWSRKARHAIFGPTELYELVKIIAEHDRLHIQQAIQGIKN